MSPRHLESKVASTSLNQTLVASPDAMSKLLHASSYKRIGAKFPRTSPKSFAARALALRRLLHGQETDSKTVHIPPTPTRRDDPLQNASGEC